MVFLDQGGGEDLETEGLHSGRRSSKYLIPNNS